MSKSLFKGKSTRTKIFTAITCAAILLLVLLNVFLTYIGDGKQLYIDMTPEQFYTLSDNMVESCETILEADTVKDKEIEIIFCSDPDTLENSYQLRPTYFMAMQMRNRFDNVKVRAENVKYNPEINTLYRTTSHREIAPTDMIVSYEGRYRVTDITTFWTQNSFSYNGEYRMVSILASLTAQSSPAAYFVTGHGETVYDPEDKDSEMSKSMASAAELIEERGLQIKTVDLVAHGKVPDDCALLIINAPTSDFKSRTSDYGSFTYVSELEMIDRYLRANNGAVIINKGHDVYLPELESFAAEWGIGFGNALVKDEKNSLTPDGTTVVGVYDKDSFGGAYYGDYAELSTAPKMVFTNSGYIYTTFAPADYKTEPGSFNTQLMYADFIYTSDGAIAYKGGSDVNAVAGKKALAAASVRTALDGDTAETTYSYLFCTNSADFFANDVIGNRSYANYGIMASLISSISRFDRYASMSLGGLSQNSPSYGGKQTQSTTLPIEDTDVYSPDAKEIIAVNKAFTKGHRNVIIWFTLAFPIALTAIGIVISVKRKHL